MFKEVYFTEFRRSLLVEEEAMSRALVSTMLRGYTPISRNRSTFSPYSALAQGKQNSQASVVPLGVRLAQMHGPRLPGVLRQETSCRETAQAGGDRVGQTTVQRYFRDAA